MKVQPNEILLIYDSNDIQDRKALGYAKSLKHHAVKEIDVQKNTLTELQFEMLADKFDLDPYELIDDKSEVFKEKYADSDLEPSDILKIMKNNPEMIKTPIAVYHDNGRIMGSAYEFIKDDMFQNGINSENANKEERS